MEISSIYTQKLFFFYLELFLCILYKLTHFSSNYRSLSENSGSMDFELMRLSRNSNYFLEQIGSIMRKSGPRGCKPFLCSTQLSMEFQMLIKSKLLKSKDFSCFQMLRYRIYHAHKIKMPTIVGILTFMSMINFMLS